MRRLAMLAGLLRSGTAVKLPLVCAASPQVPDLFQVDL